MKKQYRGIVTRIKENTGDADFTVKSFWYFTEQEAVDGAEKIVKILHEQDFRSQYEISTESKGGKKC